MNLANELKIINKEIVSVQKSRDWALDSFNITRKYVEEVYILLKRGLDTKEINQEEALLFLGEILGDLEYEKKFVTNFLVFIDADEKDLLATECNIISKL